MKILVRKHNNRLYISYIYTILFIWKIEVVTKEFQELKTLPLEDALDRSIVISSNVFRASNHIIARIFYFIDHLFVCSRYSNPLGVKHYQFTRGNIKDYKRGLITRAQLLTVSSI